MGRVRRVGRLGEDEEGEEGKDEGKKVRMLNERERG